MSRVDSARIAAWKSAEAAKAAGETEPLAKGSVVASDAFFPFADGLLAAAEAGATAVIQPGGSMRDKEVITAADERGLGHGTHRHAALQALMQTSALAIALRPTTPGDRFMVRRWLTDPEIETLVGQPGERGSGDCARHGESVRTLPHHRGRGSARRLRARRGCGSVGRMLPPDVIPPGCWDLDIFIGAASHRGRGIAQRTYRLLTREVFTTTLAVACCIITSVKNEAAVRAYEQAGFRWGSVWSDPTHGPCWVLLKERPS